MTPSTDQPRRGKLIVFEGIDGTGKSTHIARLKASLEERGITTVVSYEPTHGQWGRILRDSATSGRLPVDEEVELFLKDRREHVDELIMPALKRGDWVLLDRYYLSMMAYQGARGMDVQRIREANEAFAPVPDLVLWLDLPVDRALERIGGRGQSDSFEGEDMLRACRDVFASIDEPWMVRIDADSDRETVGGRVVDAVDSTLLRA